MNYNKTIAAGVVSLGLFLHAGSAFAGSLTVRDSKQLFTAPDVSAMQAEAKEWPFDVHLLVEDTGSRDALEDDAHAWVDGPNVMVVALDPAHHRIATRFGTGTGVKTGDVDSITHAGNAHFRSKEWKQGVDAVVLRAQASKQAKQAISSSTEPVVVEKGLSTFSWFCIVLLASSSLGFAYWLWRRSKREREEYERALAANAEETAELRSRNIKDARWEEKLYTTSSTRQPAAATTTSTVVVNNSSSGADFTTGYVLGSLSNPAPTPAPAPAPAPAPIAKPSYSTPSYSSSDSGGSSSSWSGSSSSYSSSSSSYDSGGSSSSWDSGSSSSFDGGSFGGGGDW